MWPPDAGPATFCSCSRTVDAVMSRSYSAGTPPANPTLQVASEVVNTQPADACIPLMLQVYFGQSSRPMGAGENVASGARHGESAPAGGAASMAAPCTVRIAQAARAMLNHARTRNGDIDGMQAVRKQRTC